MAPSVTAFGTGGKQPKFGMPDNRVPVKVQACGQPKSCRLRNRLFKAMGICYTVENTVGDISVLMGAEDFAHWKFTG